MTAGKRSPDGQFREPFYNREIARRIVSDLRDRGLDADCWSQKMMTYLWPNV